MTEYKRFEGETDEALILRVCRDKPIIGSWYDVCTILNKLLGAHYKPNTYRNKFQSYDRLRQVETGKSDSELLNEIKDQRRELEKEKIRFRDERAEYSKLIRQEARKESYVDLVKRTLTEYAPKALNYSPANVCASDTDMVLVVSDLHCGVEVNHYLNTFNSDILADRFVRCLDKVVEIQNRHHSENINVLISEVISGLIHENLRCENNQNIIEQFLTVSQYLSDFLVELSKHFNRVNVFVMPGNHSRISPKKESNLKGENMDNLLIPYLSAVLQNVRNVYFEENKLDEIHCFSLGDIVLRNQNPILLLSFDSPFDKCSI